MSKSKKSMTVVGTASALAALALSGAGYAQDSMDKGYEGKVPDAHEIKSDMKHGEMAAKRKAHDRKMAAAFGVEELGDIEDWEITNGGVELGSIDRLGIDRATGEVVAVVGLEGVVGVNMKEVAVPLSKLKKAGDETLSTDLTKAELQRKVDIDPWDGTYSQVISDSKTQ